jgi:hypothetical protein
LLNSVIGECKRLLHNENIRLIEPAKEKSVKEMPAFEFFLQDYLKLIDDEASYNSFEVASMLSKPIAVRQPSVDMFSQ